MNITIVAGARPNFMKIAPLFNLIKNSPEYSGKFNLRLVHTGQHYDRKMSDTFFKELNIPLPDINLNCGGGSQAEQAGSIMVSFERELIANPADLVIVVGDVTGTMSCTIVAKKLNTKVAHIEAGIRSFDMTMPEEINRMVTDCLADYFFTTTDTAGRNLRKSGIDKRRIFFVGNIMIDTLLANQARFIAPEIWNLKKLEKKNYLILTLHRPANVDKVRHLERLLNEIAISCRSLPVIFPVHPRTRKILNSLSHTFPENLCFIEPLGYLEFNWLVKYAKAIVTDSGGITEETTVMQVPCITIRDNTERPETVTLGTNRLIGTDPSAIKPALNDLFEGKWKSGQIPELWDGKTAVRIVEELVKLS